MLWIIAATTAIFCRIVAAKGSLLFLTLCIHSPQSFARVMYCQNLDFWEDVCAKYSGGAYSKDVCKF